MSANDAANASTAPPIFRTFGINNVLNMIPPAKRWCNYCEIKKVSWAYNRLPVPLTGHLQAQRTALPGLASDRLSCGSTAANQVHPLGEGAKNPRAGGSLRRFRASR